MVPHFRLFRLPVLLLFTLTGVSSPSVNAQQPLTTDGGVRERAPVLSADGQDLYFTRPDHPLNQGTDRTADVWVRHRTADGKWSRPLNPGSPINSFVDDHLLSASVDGNTLALLRSGANGAFLEQLVRSGRTWRAAERWALPSDIQDVDDLTFNTNSQQLIYSKKTAATASLDLYRRAALPGGEWGAPLLLPALSGPADERYPVIASDGRTLYFRREGGQWMRQLDRGQTAEAVELPARYLQLALAPGVAIATTDDLGQDEQLYSVTVPEAAALPPGAIVYASLGTPLGPGQRTAKVPLNSGVELAVHPDMLLRYAVVLRPRELAFPEGHMPLLSTTTVAGGLAGTTATTPNNRVQYLQESLTEKQRELDEVHQLRQERYTKTIASADIDLYTRLRSQPQRATAIVEDTLPPAAATESRERYARELAELERMKEKFRRQQEEKLRERDRGGSLDDTWYTDPDTLADSGVYFLPQNERDTTVLRSSVRSGLYPVQQPDLTERRGWERTVQGESPRQPGADAADAARLDAEYDRKLREVEALRAQLREVRGTATPPSAARTAEPVLTGKSPSATAPAVAAETAGPLGVTFITNTAYPNSGGYTALDQLVETVQQAATVIEIRVHTSPELSVRAAQILSEERATTIRNYLVEAGIAPENFRVIGYGNHESAAGERVEVIR